MQNIYNHLRAKGKIVIMPVLILIVLISIYIFNNLQKNDSAVVYANNGTFIEASGTVESNVISLSSEVTGTIEKINIEEGDSVKAGDIVAEINSSNLKNQYEQSLTNLKISEKNLELLEKSLNNLIIQNQDMSKQSESAYLTAKAEYEKVIDGASDDEINQVQEAVKQAEANLEYAESAADRTRILLDEGAVSQSKYDEVLKSHDIALAQYNSALSQLNIIKSYPTEEIESAAKNKMLQAKSGYELSISSGNTQIAQLESKIAIAKVHLEQAQKSVEQSKTELDKTFIKSPADGLVNTLVANKGEFVTAGKLLAEIYEKQNTEIRSYVSEKNIGLVKVGQEAELYVDSDSSITFKGKVSRISEEAEFTPKNIQTKEERVNTVFEVTINLEDSHGVVKPGMPVDIKIKVD
ncbi:HlyD family secretion protein [Sedimentibacter sp. B4]|uniref:HlyD family secretion protein n=1 Tax=Sedimentibacter sp. B4 TaxID=304766 RepID=UPI0002F677DE|nr:HlyD family efflux transporter periplasmic adaptor subunit [Sedimentibacter sp. B4]